MESKESKDLRVPPASSAENTATNGQSFTPIPGMSGLTIKDQGNAVGMEGGGDGVEKKSALEEASSSSSSAVKQDFTRQYPDLMRSVQEIKERLDQGSISKRSSKNTVVANTKDHQFWSTQPVPKFEETVPATVNDPIERKSIEEIRTDPYQLPSDFYWDTLDINNRETLEELYTLLHDNYVEDDDAMFRFRYSHDFLLWALKPPEWTADWHCGMRVNGNNKLVGFISAVPSQMRVRGKSMKMTEVNFLCVHKKLRSKRMAVILIKEITRRVNVRDIFQAVYTAGALLPKPVGTCRYWHRSLNPPKLVDIGFSTLKGNTIKRMNRLYKVDDEPKVAGFRQVEKKDVSSIHRLLTEYLKKFEMAPEFTMEEVEHYFMPKEKIIYSYVVENKISGELTDFVSFYSLPSTVVNNTRYDSMNAAYSFYNVATKTSWKDLMMAGIVMAKKNEFDVFNALDLMDNMQFIPELNFGIGDGSLNYYLYNWKCSEMKACEIGLVLM